MKKFLSLSVLVIMVISFQSCAISQFEGKDEVRIVKIEHSNLNELYVRANNWMVETFNNAESVIQFSDKESGTISGRYLLGYLTQNSGRVFATIKIQVKDGAAKITVSPESFQYAVGMSYYTGIDAENDVENLLNEFEQYMLQKEDNNW
jgi:hypothetical protein